MIDVNNIYDFYKNERDIEIPAIIDFVENHRDITTALDVGCHWSHAYYAKILSYLIPNYDGVDILEDPQTKAIVDKYWQQNVLDMQDVKYDLVFSISTLEHAGITTYQVEDYALEQRRVFAKMLELARKYLFLTFPFGKEALHEGQFANITNKQLTQFYILGDQSGWGLEANFYFSEFPQGGKPWKEVDLEFASTVEYKRELGTRCVCFLSIGKI